MYAPYGHQPVAPVRAVSLLPFMRSFLALAASTHTTPPVRGAFLPTATGGGFPTHLRWAGEGGAAAAAAATEGGVS